MSTAYTKIKRFIILEFFQRGKIMSTNNQKNNGAHKLAPLFLFKLMLDVFR